MRARRGRARAPRLSRPERSGAFGDDSHGGWRGGSRAGSRHTSRAGPVAGVHGDRTHPTRRGQVANGFEDRESHQAPSTPIHSLPLHALPSAPNEVDRAFRTTSANVGRRRSQRPWQLRRGRRETPQETAPIRRESGAPQGNRVPVEQSECRAATGECRSAKANAGRAKANAGRAKANAGRARTNAG
jgi:hypothetical protein